jgi:hypothetical protein
MPRRSKSEAAADRDEVARLLESLPRNLSNASPLEKAMWVLENDVSIAAVSAVMDLSETSIRRAISAKMAGREVGHNGRPTYLNTELEDQLESWATNENREGRGPSISDFVDQVRAFELGLNCSIDSLQQSFDI